MAALLVVAAVVAWAPQRDRPDAISSPTSSAAPPATTLPETTTRPSTTTTTTLAAPTTTVAGTSTTTTAGIVAVGVPERPKPEPSAPSPGTEPGFEGRGLVTVAAGGADLHEQFGGSSFVRAREGLVFPALQASGDWIEVLTSCDNPAWVRAAEVAASAPAPFDFIGSGFDFADAVIVVDPGHGERNIGAVGPSGVIEKHINLEIARRLRDLLEEPHVIDWESGRIFTGDEVPAARTVIVTRVGDGEAADYEAGLIFRAEIANAVGAHALVSIHNNAGADARLLVAGSDVFYQSQYATSRRLATLLIAEFARSFDSFEASWVGAAKPGAKSRLSPRDGVTQYYGILNSSEVPAVIAEGAYISNPSEEALLATPRFQQAYAEAVYRALVRYLSTDETGEAPLFEPEIWTGFSGLGRPQEGCVVPSQDGLVGG